MIELILYNSKSVLNFGKHKGKTILEVLTIEPAYINWCLKEIYSFVLSETALEEFKKLNTGFDFSEEIIKSNNEQIEEYHHQQYEIQEAQKEAEMERQMRKSWSNYNDNLDMDQQNEDFWDQF